jgi:hypothetical protein
MNVGLGVCWIKLINTLPVKIQKLLMIATKFTKRGQDVGLGVY